MALYNISINRKNNLHKVVLFLLLIAFCIKCILLAFFITPLWDIPDEPGHYSYIQDIAQGKGLPIMGISVMSTNVIPSCWPSMNTSANPPLNWIAQHPPLFHIIGAIVLKISMLFTQSEYWWFHITRIVSVIFGTAALYVFYLIFKEFSNEELFPITSVAAISFLPMYSHMSSGTNHDITLVFFCALSILFFLRYYLHRKISDGYLTSFFLGAAVITKISAILLTPLILLLIYYIIRGFDEKKVKKIFFIGFSFSILPVGFFIRNFLLYSTLFPNYLDLLVERKIFQSNLIEFFQSTSAFEELYKNFIALIGWAGTGKGNVITYQLDGIFFGVISCLLLFLCIGTVFWYIRRGFLSKDRLYQIFIALSIFLMPLLYIIFFINVEKPLFLKLLLTLIIYIPFLCFFYFRETDKLIKFQFISLGIILFYFLAFSQLYLLNSYEQFGYARATHGRYFFPLIPLLIISYFYPIYSILKKRHIYIYSIISLLAIFEMALFIYRIIPFYMMVNS